MRNLELSLIRFILLLLLLLSKFNFSIAQDCSIQVIPVKGYVYKDEDPITLIYDSLRTSIKDELTIILINSFGQINKKEVFILTIHGDENISAIHYNIDRKNKQVYFDGKADFQYLPKDSTSNNFYLSNCNSTVSSHKSSVLAIFNSRKKILIDYQSLDGRVLETLKDDKQYPYLNYAFDLLISVFPSLGNVN